MHTISDDMNIFSSWSQIRKKRHHSWFTYMYNPEETMKIPSVYVPIYITIIRHLSHNPIPYANVPLYRGYKKKTEQI
jgi:hypothetical protein